jgi:hypothetical protein
VCDERPSGRRRNIGQIGRLLKQQCRSLAQNVALAADEPQPVLQFIAQELK